MSKRPKWIENAELSDIALRNLVDELIEAVRDETRSNYGVGYDAPDDRVRFRARRESAEARLLDALGLSSAVRTPDERVRPASTEGSDNG